MLTNQLSTRELLGSRRFYRRNSQGDRTQYGSNSQTQSSQAGSSEGMYSQMLGSQFDSQNSDLLLPQQQDSEGSVNYYQKYKAQSALFSANQAARQPVSVVRGCPQMTLQEQMEVNRKKAKERDDREILNLFVSMLKDCVEEVKSLTTGIKDKIDKTAAAQGEKAEQLLQKVTDELGKHAGRLQDAVKRREEDKAKLHDLESALAARDAEISQLKLQLKEALTAKEDNIISTLTSTLTKQQEMTREQLSKLKDKENDNTEVLKESIKSCGEISRQLKQLEQKTKEREEAEKKNHGHKCCKDKDGECAGSYSEKNLGTNNSNSKQQSVAPFKQQSTAIAQQEQWNQNQQDINVVGQQLQNLPLKNDQMSGNWSRQPSYFHGLQPNPSFSVACAGSQLFAESTTSYPRHPAIAPSTALAGVNPTTVQVQPQLSAVSLSTKPSMVGIPPVTRGMQSDPARIYGFGRTSGTVQNPYESWLKGDNIPQEDSILSPRTVGQSLGMTKNRSSVHQGEMMPYSASSNENVVQRLKDPTNENNRQKTSDIKNTSQHQGQQLWLQDSTSLHHGQTNRDGYNSCQNREQRDVWMVNQHQGQRWSDVAGIDNKYGMIGESTSQLSNHNQRRAMTDYKQQLQHLPTFSSTSSFQSIHKQDIASLDAKDSLRDIEEHQMLAKGVQGFSPGVQQGKSGLRKQSPIATVLPQVQTRSEGETKTENPAGKGEKMKDGDGTGEPQVTITKRGRKRKKQKPMILNATLKQEEASQMESEAVDISFLLDKKKGPSLTSSAGRKKRSKSEGTRKPLDEGIPTRRKNPMEDDVVKYPSASPYSPECPPVPSQSCEDLPARKPRRSRSCTDLSNSKSEAMKTIRGKPASVGNKKTKIVGSRSSSGTRSKNVHSSCEAKTLAHSSAGLQHLELTKAQQTWRQASHTDGSQNEDQIASASVYDFDDQEDAPAMKIANNASKPWALIHTTKTRPKCAATPGGTEDANSDKKDAVKQYVSPYSDVEEPESDDPYEDDSETETTHFVGKKRPNMSKERVSTKLAFADSQILRYQDSDEKSNIYEDREDTYGEEDAISQPMFQNKKEDTFENERTAQLSKKKILVSNMPKSPESEKEPDEIEAESITQESLDPMSMDIFSQGRYMESNSPSLSKTLAIAQNWAAGGKSAKKRNSSQFANDQHFPDSDSSSSPSLWIMEDFFKPSTHDVKPQVSCTTSQGTQRKGQLTMNISDVDPGDSQEDSQSQDYFSLKIPDSPVRPRHNVCNEQVVPDPSPATPQSIRQPPSPKVSRGSGLKRKLCDSSASWFVDASRECLKQLRSGSNKSAQK